MADENSGAMKLRRLIADPSRPPEAVHHFVWARQGSEFLLEIGYFDFLELHHKRLALGGGGNVEVDFIVVHRLSMSPETVEKLAETVKNMLSTQSSAGEAGEIQDGSD